MAGFSSAPLPFELADGLEPLVALYAAAVA